MTGLPIPTNRLQEPVTRLGPTCQNSYEIGRKWVAKLQPRVGLGVTFGPQPGQPDPLSSPNYNNINSS